MRVIDLLYKIANGEAFPSDILVKGKKFEYNWDCESIEQLYRNDNGINWFDVIDINLDTVVETIEEEKKIERLDISYDRDIGDYVVETFANNSYYREIVDSKKEQMIAFKLNEIIDYLNKEQE